MNYKDIVACAEKRYEQNVGKIAALSEEETAIRKGFAGIFSDRFKADLAKGMKWCEFGGNGDYETDCLKMETSFEDIPECWIYLKKDGQKVLVGSGVSISDYVKKGGEVDAEMFLEDAVGCRNNGFLFEYGLEKLRIESENSAISVSEKAPALAEKALAAAKGWSGEIAEGNAKLSIEKVDGAAYKIVCNGGFGLEATGASATLGEGSMLRLAGRKDLDSPGYRRCFSENGELLDPDGLAAGRWLRNPLSSFVNLEKPSSEAEKFIEKEAKAKNKAINAKVAADERKLAVDIFDALSKGETASAEWALGVAGVIMEAKKRNAGVDARPVTFFEFAGMTATIEYRPGFADITVIPSGGDKPFAFSLEKPDLKGFKEEMQKEAKKLVEFAENLEKEDEEGQKTEKDG